MSRARDWTIVLGLALGVSVSNSFARFAYGLILPAMRSDLDWTYTEAGWINTANALGYIAGALLTFALIGRLAPRTLFIAGLLVTSFSLVFSGMGSGFWYLTFWRILAGIAGAPVFIAGGVLAASLFRDDPGRNALAIALYFGGGGIGIVASGAVLPGLLAADGAAGWPWAWIALGVASLTVCPVSIWAAMQFRDVEGNRIDAGQPVPVAAMTAALSGYALFACGYIVYLTFLVAAMRGAGTDPVTVSMVWVVLGLGIVVSPFLWKPVLARWSNGVPLALATVATAAGTLLPLAWTSLPGLLTSASVFGASVFIAPSAVTAFSRKNLTQAAWGKAVALFTILFSVGQTIGPVAAGWIGDVTGDIRTGLLAAGIVLLIGAALALLQRPLAKTEA